MIPKNKSLVAKILSYGDFFNEEMGRIQQEVEQLRALEAVYVVARDVLIEEEGESLEGNDVKVNRHGDTINVNTVFVKGQHWKDLQWVVNRIDAELKRKGLRGPDQEPPSPSFGWFVRWRFGVRAREGMWVTLYFIAEVPSEGTDMVTVSHRTKTIPVTDTDFMWADVHRSWVKEG